LDLFDGWGSSVSDMEHTPDSRTKRVGNLSGTRLVIIPIHYIGCWE
jgi:hypothetical protein